jgi:hypothetical protein
MLDLDNRPSPPPISRESFRVRIRVRYTIGIEDVMVTLLFSRQLAISVQVTGIRRRVATAEHSMPRNESRTLPRRTEAHRASEKVFAAEDSNT